MKIRIAVTLVVLGLLIIMIHNSNENLKNAKIRQFLLSSGMRPKVDEFLTEEGWTDLVSVLDDKRPRHVNLTRRIIALKVVSWSQDYITYTMSSDLTFSKIFQRRSQQNKVIEKDHHHHRALNCVHFCSIRRFMLSSLVTKRKMMTKSHATATPNISQYN